MQKENGEQDVRILTIDELQERWELLKWQRGIETLIITEQLKDNDELSLVVNGLTMEFQDDMALCGDNEDVLYNSPCRLNYFLKKYLTSIKLLPIQKGTGYREKLEFDDRVIFIESYC